MIIVLLKYLNISIAEESEYLANYSFNSFTLLLVLLFSIINAFGFLLSIILIQKYDLVIKYPKLKSFIKYYEKTSIFFFTMEVLLSLFIILFLMIYSYYNFMNFIIK